jgi:hypothetical protein
MDRYSHSFSTGLPNPIFRNPEISSKKLEVHQEFFFLKSGGKTGGFFESEKHLMAVLRIKLGFSFTKALVTSFYQTTDGKIF